VTHTRPTGDAQATSGKRRSPSTKRGRKSKASKFTAEKFRWLEQLACDNRLPPLAARLAILLSAYFNLDYDGAAWPSQETLATKLGVTREWVGKTLGALVAFGYLEATRRGRNHTNLYRMAVPEPAEKAADDVNYRSHHNADDVNSSPEGCELPVHTTPLKTPGVSKETPKERREREKENSDEFSIIHGALRSQARAPIKEIEEENSSPPEDSSEYQQLRAAWPRPFADDDAADRRAFAEARAVASFEEIMAGASAWAAAADAPRFLQPLAEVPRR
jgi:hypothetical protein